MSRRVRVNHTPLTKAVVHAAACLLALGIRYWILCHMLTYRKQYTQHVVLGSPAEARKFSSFISALTGSMTS